MPNISSAKKRLRQSEKRHARNGERKHALKQTVKAIKRAVAARDREKAESLIPQLMKVADKAAQRRVIHPNRAARLKSRLIKKIQAIP